MKETIHIPYGANLIDLSKNENVTSVFYNADKGLSLKNFCNNFCRIAKSDIAYLYFLTTSYRYNSSFCTTYGIFAYTISNNRFLSSCRIDNVSKDESTAIEILSSLTKNAVAPSHIAYILDDETNKNSSVKKIIA